MKNLTKNFNFDSFPPSVVFDIETSHLICIPEKWHQREVSHLRHFDGFIADFEQNDKTI